MPQPGPPASPETPSPTASTLVTPPHGRPVKEPPLAQMGSFVDLFVWLLVLKSFFLPLFIIPTGSMAETLAGAHATNTCPNCGYDYMIGPQRTQTGDRMPDIVQCPNCRLLQAATGPQATTSLRQKAGDRIMVHGWPFAIGGWGAPQRWDVVVFKNPNEPDVNFIKRLVGLPGETVEIINGDVFVIPPGEETARIAQKTHQAQKSLWFPYFDQDYLPREPSTLTYRDRRTYWPHWGVTGAAGDAWKDLDTRRPRFDGLSAERQEITFVTDRRQPDGPGEIVDHYGYNARPHRLAEIVSDVRLGVDVRLLEGDGMFDLTLRRFDDTFVARVTAAGQVQLLHARGRAVPEPIGAPVSVDVDRTFRLALGHADGRVLVEVDGQAVLDSGTAYTITPEVARRQERPRRSPTLRMAAEGIRLELSRVRIDRDVHYRQASISERRLGNGVSGNPLRIPDDAYFVLGDNSPASEDSRRWHEGMLGPHLIESYRNGTYTLGTVPAQDMIGKAFLVYWPGFLPLTPNGPNIVLDLGRVRWIH